MDKISSNLLVALIVWILNILYSKYFKHKMPDEKKAISYIKKSLDFIFKYILFVLLIIYSIIYTEFDKFFFINVLLGFFGIFLGIIMDLINLKIRNVYSVLDNKKDKKN